MTNDFRDEFGVHRHGRSLATSLSVVSLAHAYSESAIKCPYSRIAIRFLKHEIRVIKSVRFLRIGLHLTQRV